MTPNENISALNTKVNPCANLYVMSNTKDQSNTSANAAKLATQTAEDTLWIANIDAQIAEAVAQGKFRISAISSKGVDLKTVFQYYANLGYVVWFPDYPTNLNYQPVDLFGAYWDLYWTNQFALYRIKNPARMIVSWR